MNYTVQHQSLLVFLRAIREKQQEHSLLGATYLGFKVIRLRIVDQAPSHVGRDGSEYCQHWQNQNPWPSHSLCLFRSENVFGNGSSSAAASCAWRSPWVSSACWSAARVIIRVVGFAAPLVRGARHGIVFRRHHRVEWLLFEKEEKSNANSNYDQKIRIMTFEISNRRRKRKMIGAYFSTDLDTGTKYVSVMSNQRFMQKLKRGGITSTRDILSMM